MNTSTLTTLTTEYSTYELDQTNRRMRRISSSHAASPNQPADGEWRDYTSLDWWGPRLLVTWGMDGSTLRRTLTSSVINVDGEAIDAPEYQGD